MYWITILKKNGLIFTFSTIALFTTVFSDASETNADVPAIELLEFLADFETDDGRWIDPVELEGMMNVNLSDSESEAKDDE